MNKRQIKIIEYMNKTHEYIRSKDIASMFSVTQRTAQNDLKDIVTYFDYMRIEYSYNKDFGYKILSANPIINYQPDEIQKNIRAKFILRTLLFAKNFIKLENLSNELYVSPTTLAIDLKNAKEIAKKYDLNIISKPYYGSIIQGNEKDIRSCIIQEKLIAFHEENNKQQFYNTDILCVISGIVSDILIKNRYNISDSDYQNFLMITFLSTIRSINGFFLNFDYLSDLSFGESYYIAQDIVKKISSFYKYVYNEVEARYIASSLFGKNSLISTEIIPIEIEQHVNNILNAINQKYDIDLTYSVELRLSLSLHLIPLLERINSNNQINELSALNIHNNFSFSFELAIIAAQYIESFTYTQLTGDELAYLAIHFAVIFEKDGNKKSKNTILFICSSRRSDSLLIKSVIYSHFPERINSIDIKNLYELKNVDFNKYDVVFSTVLNSNLIPTNAIKVNHFLTENDFQSIEFALINGSVFKMIEPLFSKKRFISNLSFEKKEDVLKELSKVSCDFIDSALLYSSIMNRENNGFTAYGNLVALPHPDHLLSNQSFCSVAILANPMIWSESTPAQIIILCCASKSSCKDLQMLFNFISLLFNDKNKVDEIIKTSTFESFMKCLSNLQHSKNTN